MNPHDIHCHPSRIVAAVDASQRSHRAVSVAIAIGERLGIQVELLVAETGRERAASVARSLMADHKALTPLSIDARETAAPPLVVTSVRSRQWPDPASVDHPGQGRRPWITIGPSLRPVGGRRVDHLVLPLDGTPELEALIDTGIAWAGAHGLGLQLLGVVADGPPPIRPPRRPSPRRRFTAEPRTHIDELVASRSASGVDLKVDVVRDPIGLASALEHQLRHIPEALLLMPSARASTRRVVRRSPVPVMLVPAATVAPRQRSQ